MLITVSVTVLHINDSFWPLGNCVSDFLATCGNIFQFFIVLNVFVAYSKKGGMCYSDGLCSIVF